ncbi:MAG: hypothetical protein QM676_02720 [Novosphingobium sp.]
MKYILIPIIVVLVVMVVVSLVKGIVAFLNATKADLEQQDSGPSANQLLQNKMMFNRIKYQALAVVVVAILLAVSK